MDPGDIDDPELHERAEGGERHARSPISVAAANGMRSVVPLIRQPNGSTAVLRLSSRTKDRGRARLSAVVFGVVVMLSVFVGVGWSAIAATYAGMDARDLARAPVRAQTEAEASFLYAAVHDSLITTDEDIQIVYLSPLNTSAPLPPGVRSWPAEGQVVMSPGLLEAGAAEGIAQRYGEVVGEIGVDGLATPTEKLAYVRPTAETLDPGVMTRASGYGQATDGFLGDALNRKSLWQFGVAFLMTVGVAWGACVVVAVRTDLEHRREEDHRLTVLGATRRERVAWQVGKLGRAWVIGAVAGLLVSLPVFIVNTPVPGRGLTLLASDMRSGAGMSVAVTVVMAAVAGIATVLSAVRSPKRSSRKRARTREARFSRRAAVACCVSAPIAVVLELLAQGTGEVWIFVAYIAALLVVLATIYHLVGVVIEWCGVRMRSVGHARQNPVKIVAGAGFISNSRPIATAGAFLAIIMILASQVDGILMGHSQAKRESEAADARFGGQVMEIYAWPSTDLSHVAGLLEDAREAGGAQTVVAMSETREGDTTDVVLGLDQAAGDVTVDSEGRVSSPGPSNVADYVSWRLDEQDRVVDARPLEDVLSEAAADRGDSKTEYRFAVVTDASHHLDEAAVKTAVAHDSAPMWRAWTPGSSDVVGLTQDSRHASWLGWLGIIAIFLGAGAVSVSLIEDVWLTGQRLAPVGVLAGAHRLPRMVAVIRLIVPVAVSFAVGTVMSAALASAVTVAFESPLSYFPPFIAGSLVAVAIVLTVMVALMDRFIARALDNWKVGDHRA